MLSKQVKARIKRNKQLRLIKWARKIKWIDDSSKKVSPETTDARATLLALAHGLVRSTPTAPRALPNRSVGESEFRSPEFSRWCMENPLNLGAPDAV